MTVGFVYSDAGQHMTLSRNKRYEQKMKDEGLVKRTLWIPEHCESEFKQMAQACVLDRDQIPFMTRSIKTGRMKKAVD